MGPGGGGGLAEYQYTFCEAELRLMPLLLIYLTKKIRLFKENELAGLQMQSVKATDKFQGNFGKTVP